MTVANWFRRHVTLGQRTVHTKGRAILAGTPSDPFYWLCKWRGGYALCSYKYNRHDGGILHIYPGHRPMEQILLAAEPWRAAAARLQEMRRKRTL